MFFCARDAEIFMRLPRILRGLNLCASRNFARVEFLCGVKFRGLAARENWLCAAVGLSRCGFGLPRRVAGKF